MNEDDLCLFWKWCDFWALCTCFLYHLLNKYGLILKHRFSLYRPRHICHRSPSYSLVIDCRYVATSKSLEMFKEKANTVNII